MPKQVAVGVLIVEAQPADRALCQAVVRSLGCDAFVAESALEALQVLERRPVDLIVASISTPGMSGLELLHVVKSRGLRVQVLFLADRTSAPLALEALRLGACAYLMKPFDPEELKLTIERVARTLDLEDENRILRERLRSRTSFGRLVGQSEPMQHAFRLIQRVAPSRTPVLITGESGTGKELVARSIHENSPWRDRPFVPVDCGALVPTLIESELFGYVRGAFTGAVRSKAGLLETAESGTLFLDEVGELPVELQTRLLRAIQEKEFRPVGSTKRVPFGARVISATNRNLKEAVQQGTFRKDLYFRLNVVSIHLPPLRERRADIPLLAERLLRNIVAARSDAKGQLPWTISSEALDRMLSYDWPGNVRELENCIERAVTLGSGPVIQASDLPSSVAAPVAYSGEHMPQSVIPLDEMERQAILRALATTGGDKVLAAKLLGIGKTTLYRKLRKYMQKE